ncbi:MAG: hypothetical protein V1897_18820 [Pseudomonadota bacterium]
MCSKSLMATMKIIAYSLILSAILITDLAKYGHAPSFGGIVFLTWLPFSCVIWGLIYLKSFSLSERDLITTESCLISGFWVSSLAILVPVFLSPSFIFAFALIASWNIAPLCFLMLRPEALRIINLQWSNVWILLTVGLAMSLWCQTGIIQKIQSVDHITFLPWSDHFVHASIIQRLYECQKLGVLQEFGLICGISAPLYHYGSYMMSVVLRAVDAIPAINISTAFWLPMGAILSGLAAFALGNSLWGKKEGIAACVAVTLMPDPYMYGCGLGYFSYHFLGQTGAALYYAEAFTAIGLTLIAAAMRSGARKALMAGFIPIISSVFFKAHVFVVAFPAACLWTILFFSSIAKTRRAMWMLSVGAGCVTSVLIFSRLGYISIGEPWALEFFRGIFAGASPNDPWMFTRLFGFTQKTMTIWDDLVVGTILLWFATLGPLLMVGILLICYLKRKRSLNSIDSLPFLFLAVWTAMVMILPSNQYGNLDEFHHRPFHVVYYIFVIWVAARLSNLILPLSFNSLCQHLGLLAPMIGLMLIPWYYGKDVLKIGPCAHRHQNFKIDKGMWEAGEFIRSYGKLGDIFLDSQEDSYLNVVTGIGEQRPFLSEPYHFFVSRHASGSILVEQRQKLHDELKRCDSVECISRIAKAYNVRWYLTHPSDSLTWEPNLDMKPVFESHGYRVFDLYIGPRVD